MNLTQRLITSLVSPATAREMEAHSRAWKMRCPHCQHTRSFWDSGGIRYKAFGNPRKLRRCPNCGRVGWHATTYEPAA